MAASNGHADETSEDGNALLAISVDADDYASAAAGDSPSVPRTYQSEAAFLAQKRAYSAQIDGEGSTYARLMDACPILQFPRSEKDEEEEDEEEEEEEGDEGNVVTTHSPGSAVNGSGSGVDDDGEKVKLSKKDVQLLSYAVAELYYDREYQRVLVLCRRVQQRCLVDAKTTVTVERWMRRCRERLRRAGGDSAGCA